MLVILDVDGTLADAAHRESLRDDVNGGYFKPETVYKDEPVKAAQRVVSRLQELKYDIVVITERDESLRDATSRWLLENFNFAASDESLLMLPQGGFLPVAERKRQLMQQVLAEYRARGLTSFMFIDDDVKTCEMYGAEGLALKAPECWSVVFPENKE